MPMLDDIREFHEKFGLEYNGKPRALPTDLADFRHVFMLEEAGEWANSNDEAKAAEQYADRAEYTYQLEKQLDAIIDLLYVVMGTAYLQGFDEKILTEAWTRVHTANMKKVRAQSAEDSKRGSAHDVVKPDGWEPPDHTDLIEDNAYEA